ncbi:MAG TPA: substrate-binding domain-containing protein [Candidatus Competibacter sp.]|nr:ABC transporter substrate-binding protein [Candidatus Competibacteraceae bacterium]HRE54820.1 substrate-binding domain-containing protein [Candidatus Competibacter sp.]
MLMLFSVKGGGIAVIGLIAAWATWIGLPEAASAETLTVGGTGSSTPLIERFAQAYAKLKPEITVRVIDPPIGSSGSIRAILAGASDLAVPGRPLNDEEKARGGQDWELGRTPFLIVTSQKQPQPGFSFAQLAAIYEGKQTAWPDGSPIRLVMRSPTESDTLLLRKLSPEMDRAFETALARPGILVAANDLENLQLLEKTPGSLGTTNLGLLKSQNSTLQVLDLNGMKPGLDDLREGRYPYYKTLYLARGPKLSPAAQGFIDFMLSTAGKEILEHSNYQPASARP